MSRGARSLLVLAGVSLAMLTSRDARADGPFGGMGSVVVLVGVGALVLPSAAGADFSLDPRAPDGARLLLGWPLQIPLTGGDTLDWRRQPTWRLVLAPEVVIGRQLDVAPDHATHVTFRMHTGLRAVTHLRRSEWGVVTGMGSTFDFWPKARASLAPELGLHIGGEPAATLILRADFWSVGPDLVRISACVGYTFF